MRLEKITGIIAVISLIIGLNWLGKPSANQSTLLNFLLLDKNKIGSDSSEVVLFTKLDEIFEKMLSALLEEEEKARSRNLSVPPQFLGKTIYKVKLCNDEKAISISFDDGPWPETTNHILYILKKHDVKATFFVLGRNVQNYPARLKQIVQHGHVIGNHTWSHSYRYHNKLAAAREIDNTAALLYKITGVKTSLFRPPGGFLNNGLVAYASKKKYAILMWSVDSKDYYASGPNLLNKVIRQAKFGGIVLMHDGGGDRSNTVWALPHIIIELKKRGYKFVTVPELLKLGRDCH